jgi:uncharacterized protein YkwD
MARIEVAADHPYMASGGGRILAVLAWMATLVAVAAPAAVASPSTHRSTLVALESGVLRQLNAIRADHGLGALRPSLRLNAAAAQHSREMAADGYFDHNSFDGTSFSTRISHWYPTAGYRRWSVGENLLWSSPTVDPGGALDLWMGSPEHRANILNPRWREIGIGAVHSTTAGGTFKHLPVTIITTDFGVRR